MGQRSDEGAEARSAWEQADLNALTPGLRRVALRILADEAAADDVVQDVWLASLETRSPATGDLGPWLRAVARNVARDERGRVANRKARERRVARADAFVPDDLDIDREGARAKLHDALTALRGVHAEAIRLRYLEELSTVEVAARLERPEGTIKTWVRRGLDELRARLSSELSGRRGFALVLVGSFDWEPDELPSELRLAAGASAAASSLALSWWWLAAPFVVLVAAAWYLVGERADDELARVETPPIEARPGVPADAPPEVDESDEVDTGARTPVEPEPEPVDPAPVLAPDDPSVEALEALPLGTFALVTLIGVDDAGLPVGQVWANIWDGVSSHTTTLGREAAGPESAGRLEIPVLESYLYRGQRALGADPASTGTETLLLYPFAEGAARGDTLFVSLEAGDRREVTVTFDFAALSLVCRVRDTDGQAIPSAYVLVGEDRFHGEHEPGISRSSEATLRVTDGAGNARFPYERAGRTSIQVDADGYLPSAWVFDTTGMEQFTADLVLEKSLAVVGVVVDADDAPVSGAVVWAESTEYDGALKVRTSEDGSFLLPSVSPGRQRLWARGPKEWLVATGIVEGRQGEEARWDATLRPTVPIRVHVFGEGGAPLRGAYLYFRVQDDLARAWHEDVLTNGAGEAVVWRDPGVPVMVHLREGDPLATGEVVPFKTVRDLRPREEAYRIDVLASERPRSTLRGRFVDPRGRVWTDAKVTVTPKTIGYHHDIAYDPMSGAFEVGALSAGEYIVRLERERGGLHSVPVTLGFEEERDLGDIVTELPGELVIESSWPREVDGLPVEEHVASVADEFGTAQLVSSLRATGTAAGTYAVLPGVFRVIVQIGENHVQRRTVRVRAGEIVQLVLGPGAPHVVAVELLARDGQGLPEEVLRTPFKIEDGRSQQSTADAMRVLRRADGSLWDELRLPSGTWRVDYKSADGREARIELELGDMAVVGTSSVTLEPRE